MRVCVIHWFSVWQRGQTRFATLWLSCCFAFLFMCYRCSKKSCDVRSDKVKLHRYICLWGASERKLGKSLKSNQKDPRKNQGKRALSHKIGHTKNIRLVWKIPQTSWAIFILRWEDQLPVLCAEANKMFMRAVQQIVFLILNRVPVTFVTDPELIRPSIPVMTHSLDQKVMFRKVKARKCTAEIGCWKYPSEGR